MGAASDPGPSREPALVGLIGHPVAGNPTGRMFEAAFAAAGLDWRYLSMDVASADLEAAVGDLLGRGFRGFHVTVPHKVAVVPLMARLTPAASAIGAVNCAIREGDGWLGENTDGKGFLTALETVMLVPGLRVCLLGAGGAARAVAMELALAGAADIVIVNRNRKRGQDLAARIAATTATPAVHVPWSEPIHVPPGTDILVQATSLGLNSPSVGPRLDWATAGPTLLVADVVMSPPRTRLLREAEEASLRTLDGRAMLVNQAVAAFRLWTGVEADPSVMHDALAAS
jgi:shikimate dehydrogenase